MFETNARPTLTSRCLKCHGESKQEGGLRLDTRESALAGGDSGPAISPGKPKESLLLEAVRYQSLEMPPDGRLADEAIQRLSDWIAAGAPWPEGERLRKRVPITVESRRWWAYQPVQRPAVPNVSNPSWCRNEIDRFILARLENEGLQPSPEATETELTRRLGFTLTGLPPNSPNNDGVSDQLVEALLKTSAYGEHQARFWLDLVRYAETDGYRADFARDEAYRYRDYVIRSFNSDKPFNRFVIEQLAGDEIDPGNRDALIATMYLRHWIYEWNQRDVELQWSEILNDITETTADVFLAQGLKCARCHDHKFDPLLQQDFFRMKAFFAALLPREDQPVGDLAARTTHFEKQKLWEESTSKIRARLHEIETPALMKHATREGVDKFVTQIREMIATQPERRNPYSHQIASLASRQFDVHPDKLPEWLSKELEAERQALRAELTKFDSMKPDPLPTLKFVASDVGPTAPSTWIPDDPQRTPIAPGFPTIFQETPAKIEAPPTALRSTGRRTALARWIAANDNPLTARVIVNRVWQQHFGRGLVATTSDFGHLGEPPSHPELLDWLASRFMADGWSLKQLHRRIVQSATWRQSSRSGADATSQQKDPQNVLLWRMNSRRLAGEEINDAILTASGELSSLKRAIYKPVKRNSPDLLLSVFDFPDRIRSQGKRHQTTTAPQALMLVNNEWLYERAAATAGQFPDLDDEAFVRQVYWKIYSRPVTPQELDTAGEFLSSYEASTSGSAAEAAVSESGEAPRLRKSRSAFVHALFNTNEFLYVD